MRTLKTGEAAALLNVSPNTLRTWEQRFGYPSPQRSPGSHRLYAYAEIAALKDALRQGLSVSSAVSMARDSLRADVSALVHALASLRVARAEDAMAASLALGSAEDAIEGLLLPSLGELLERKGARSAPFAFGVSWANDWLRRAERLVSTNERHHRVLIGDASEPAIGADSPYVRALEFFCTRAGADVISLPIRAVGSMPDVLAAFRPNVLVISGRWASHDEVSQWTYAVRSTTGRIPIALYRRRPQDSFAGTDLSVLTTESPSQAQGEIFVLIRSNGHLLRHK